jgi:hypothetical protein
MFTRQVYTVNILKTALTTINTRIVLTTSKPIAKEDFNQNKI